MNHYKLWIASIIILIFLLAGGAAYAQTSPSGYDLSWHTVDGGGDTLTDSSGYTLNGTAGQPDAGPVLTDSSGYSLTGGFWPAASSGGGGGSSQSVYLPVVIKS